MLSFFLAKAALGLGAWVVVIAVTATTQTSDFFYNYSNSNTNFAWIAFFWPKPSIYWLAPFANWPETLTRLAQKSEHSDSA